MSDEDELRDKAEKLYWFFRMVENGGPDGSDLDALVWEEARAAAATLDFSLPGPGLLGKERTE